MSSNKLQIGLTRRKHPLAPPPRVRNAGDFISTLEQKMSEAEEQHDHGHDDEHQDGRGEGRPEDQVLETEIKKSKPPAVGPRPGGNATVNNQRLQMQIKSMSMPSQSQSQSTSIPRNPSGVYKYAVLYRTMSAKKHKSWEGDGELFVDRKILTLKDMDENIVESCLSYNGNVDLAKLSSGSFLKLGDKEIEIQELIGFTEKDTGLSSNNSNEHEPEDRIVETKKTIKPPPAARGNGNGNQRLQKQNMQTNTNSMPNQNQSSSMSIPKNRPGIYKYAVLFRKMTAKKHKTWDGDGELTVDCKTLVLKEVDEILGSCSNYSGNVDLNNLSAGSMIKIGDREVEIQELIGFKEKQAQSQLNDVSKRSIDTLDDEPMPQPQSRPLQNQGKIDLSRFVKVKTKRPRIDQNEPAEDEMKPEEAKKSSQQMPTSSSMPIARKESGVLKYAVLYRKMTTRKNKSWDGDGELTIDGKALLLKDMDEKIVGSCSNYTGNVDLYSLSVGSMIKIGEREIEIQEQIGVTNKDKVSVNAYDYD